MTGNTAILILLISLLIYSFAYCGKPCVDYEDCNDNNQCTHDMCTKGKCENRFVILPYNIYLLRN